MKKNVPPGVVVLVIAVLVIVIALWFYKGTQGGTKSQAVQKSERRVPTWDPKTGKLVIMQLPPAGKVKGAALPENKGASTIYTPPGSK